MGNSSNDHDADSTASPEKKRDEKERGSCSCKAGSYSSGDDGAADIAREGAIASMPNTGGHADAGMDAQSAQSGAKEKFDNSNGVKSGVENVRGTEEVTCTHGTSVLQKQQQQRQHGSEESRDTAGRDELPLLVRRPRKRGRARGKRTRVSTLMSGHDDGEEEETTLRDVALLQEAQRYRNARVQKRGKDAFVESGVSRGADDGGVGVGGSGKVKRDVENNTEDDTEMGEGLEMRFATERSGNVIEARMERYVQERMREKFGGVNSGSAFGREEDGVEKMHGERKKVLQEEEELYKVPVHLQVAPRPDYDPAEGLPAAGVEEVALPEEVRLRNEKETRAARERMGLQRLGREREGLKRDLKKDTQGLLMTGNLSANFVRHRRQWIENHVQRNQAAAKNVGKGAHDAELRTLGERDGDKKNVAQITALGTHTGKRTEMASDAALFDRFRKRWRR